MKNKTAVLAALLFFVPNAHHAQLAFPDYPLLSAPHDKIPYYAVGLISETKDHVTLKCTGTLIAPTVVLTAAHCLYDPETSAWHNQRYFFPSLSIQDGGTALEAKRYVIPKNFAITNKEGKRDINRENSSDFGIMVLDRQVDDALASVFSATFRDTSLVTANYPQLPPPSSLGPIRRILDPLPRESSFLRILAGYPQSAVDLTPQPYVTFCPLAPYWLRGDDGEKYFFYAHRCSTYSGMSGSPIFYMDTDRSYRILGIHSGGSVDGRHNKGVYIDRKKYLRIQHWIANQVSSGDMSIDF